MESSAAVRKGSMSRKSFMEHNHIRIFLVIHKIQTLDIDNGLFPIRYLDMSVDNVDNFVDSVGKQWGQSF